MIPEHSLVVLDRNIADRQLVSGDVGTVVHVHGQGEAYEVEFVDGKGSTIALLTLPASEIRPIESGELLHARKRA
jgi:hypothetical protein